LDTLFFTLIGIGIVSSFIGTLAGGGGLITLPAMMLVGIPIQIGIATNKFSSGVAALTSVSYLLKNKHLSGKTIVMNVCIALVGGVSGALITSSMTEQSMNIIALVLLIFAFIVTLKNKQWVSSVKETDKDTSSIISNIIPFFIAAYDGGFGPGSSTFGILYYMHRNLYESSSAYESFDPRKLSWSIYCILSNRICTMALCYCDGYRISSRISNWITCIT
jgi:uncharacterized protein